MPKSVLENKLEKKSFTWLSFAELESNFNELLKKYTLDEKGEPKSINSERKKQIDEIAHVFNRLKLIRSFSQPNYKNYLKGYLNIKDNSDDARDVVFELSDDEYAQMQSVIVRLAKEKNEEKLELEKNKKNYSEDKITAKYNEMQADEFREILSRKRKINADLDFTHAYFHPNYLDEHFHFNLTLPSDRNFNLNNLTEADYSLIATGILLKIKKEIASTYRVLSAERSDLYKFLNIAIGLTPDVLMKESDDKLALEALDRFNHADLAYNGVFLKAMAQIKNDPPKLRKSSKPTEDHLLYVKTNANNEILSIKSSPSSVFAVDKNNKVSSVKTFRNNKTGEFESFRDATAEEVAAIKKKAVNFFPVVEPSDPEPYLIPDLSEKEKRDYEMEKRKQEQEKIKAEQERMRLEEQRQQKLETEKQEKLRHDHDFSIFKNKLKLHILGPIRDFDPSKLNKVKRKFR